MVASPPDVTTQASLILDALYHGRHEEAERLAREAGEDALTIHEAAAVGSVSRLNALLAEDRSLVNAFASNGFQPLGLAAFFGQREAAAQGRTAADLARERGQQDVLEALG